MIQIQGLDRVDLTHKLDDVRQRIMAIENKFGIGGDFQTALNRELNKGIVAQTQQIQSAQKTDTTQKLLDGTKPVNEADAVNSAKVAEILNSINKNANTTQPKVTAPNSAENNSSTKIFPGAEALPGKIMQNNQNPAAGNSNAAISSQTAPKSSALDEDVFEADEEVTVTESSSSYSTPEVVSQKVNSTATKHGVDPKLAEAIAIAESGLDQSDISDAGAIGVMQLMPATAVELGVDPYDEDENIDGGVRFLGQMLDRFGGNVELAVAAYNAGPNAVEKFGGVPPYGETQAYVQRVMSLYK